MEWLENMYIQLQTIPKYYLNSQAVYSTYCPGSVSDPYSLNPDPDPAKNLNPDPDPSWVLTLPGINIKLFYNFKIFPSKDVNLKI